MCAKLLVIWESGIFAHLGKWLYVNNFSGFKNVLSVYVSKDAEHFNQHIVVRNIIVISISFNIKATVLPELSWKLSSMPRVFLYVSPGYIHVYVNNYFEWYEEPYYIFTDNKWQCNLSFVTKISACIQIFPAKRLSVSLVSKMFLLMLTSSHQHERQLHRAVSEKKFLSYIVFAYHTWDDIHDARICTLNGGDVQHHDTSLSLLILADSTPSESSFINPCIVT